MTHLTHSTNIGPACRACKGTVFGYHVADYAIDGSGDLRSTITSWCAGCHETRTWDTIGSHRDSPAADIRKIHQEVA